jgi:hypothetical protein
MLSFSTSAVGYTDQQTSFSSLIFVFKLQLSLRFQLVQLICVQCVWDLTFLKVTIFSMCLLW